MIRVYDSLSRQVVPLKTQVPNQVSIYSCGVTPYDHSHIGHARPAVVWDVIRRHLERRGYGVTYVQNFTDIDDKIIRRSAESGVGVEELANRYINEYQKLLMVLGVRPPDFAPKVTENIPEIVHYIEELVARQKAYVTSNGVYFRVSGDAQYGQLSKRTPEELREGARIEVDPSKEAPADFALWKTSDGSGPSWESPWGAGRPGWHIECSAMSLKYLGAHFDMHGGGIDLIFPHHENERAQSRAYTGDEPVSVWVHSGLITRQGVKMSKSLQNGVTLAELLEKYPGHVLRTYLLSVHYRTPLDFEERYIGEWQTALQRLWRLWDDVQDASPAREVVSSEWASRLIGFEGRFLAALDEDFNTAGAFAEVFDMVSAAYQGINQGYGEMARGLARRNLAKANDILGFFPGPHGVVSRDTQLVEALVAARNQARTRRDYPLADALRQVFLDAGYEVLDGPDGTRVHHVGS